VSGIARSYGLPVDYALYEMSYVNLVMYGAVLPGCKSEKNKNEVINADDPANRYEVRKIIYGR
jgi:hypothetical protein